MKPYGRWMVALSLALTCGLALAHDAKEAPPMSAEQKAMMDAYERMGEVRAEHKQLAYFAGNWTAKTTMVMDPTAPPQTTDGKAKTESVFGGRSYETHYDGLFMGEPFTGRAFMGFDNLKSQFYSTWMDDMSTGFWISYGSYDAATKAYTLRADMDDPLKPGTKIPVRQVIRVVDDKHYIFEWNETKDGKETKTMWIEYTRI